MRPLSAAILLILASAPAQAGTWAVRADRGAVPVGVYCVRFEADGVKATRRFVIAR